MSRSRVDEKQFAVQFRNENGVAIIIGRKNKPRPNWLQLRNPQLGISMSADRALIRKPRRKRNVNESDDTPTRPPQTIKDSETNNDAVINFDSQQRKSNIMPLVKENLKTIVFYSIALRWEESLGKTCIVTYFEILFRP